MYQWLMSCTFFVTFIFRSVGFTCSCVDQFTCWEAFPSSRSQEMPHTSWFPKVLYRIHKSHTNPIDALPSCLKTQFNIILLSTFRFSRRFLSWRFTLQYCVWISLLFHVATCCCPWLDMTTLTISGEQYKSWSFSLCNILQFPVLPSS